jgi:hypothetical protein
MLFQVRITNIISEKLMVPMTTTANIVLRIQLF